LRWIQDNSGINPNIDRQLQTYFVEHDSGGTNIEVHAARFPQALLKAPSEAVRGLGLLER